MKKLILTLAAVPLAAYAAGASAQTYANAGGTAAVQNRITNLEGRFNSGLSVGVFTTAERNSISRQLTELRNLERSYSYNGLSQAERRTLQQRIRTVRDQLRTAGGPNWARSYGWSDAELDAPGSAYGQSGSYDAYGRPIHSTGETYDRNGRPINNNGVVYDQDGRAVANGSVMSDRYGRPIADEGVVYDRYGRPVNGGYAGQGGPYEPNSQGSQGGSVLGGVLGSVIGGGSGVGGVLGSVIGGGGGGMGGVLGSVVGGGRGMGGVLGSILSRGGLRTGDVITGAIGSVLGSAVGSGSQFRDTSNVYYRSDGERVYEIDARTNTVNRVYPVQR